MPSFGIERRCDRCRYGQSYEKHTGSFRDDTGCIVHLHATMVYCKRFPKVVEKGSNNWCFEFTPTLAVVWARLRGLFNAP